jgi:hypothetical protein
VDNEKIRMLIGADNCYRKVTVAKIENIIVILEKEEQNAKTN